MGMAMRLWWDFEGKALEKVYIIFIDHMVCF